MKIFVSFSSLWLPLEEFEDPLDKCCLRGTRKYSWATQQNVVVVVTEGEWRKTSAGWAWCWDGLGGHCHRRRLKTGREEIQEPGCGCCHGNSCAAAEGGFLIGELVAIDNKLKP